MLITTVNGWSPLMISVEELRSSFSKKRNSYDLATLIGETKLQARIPIPLSPAAERRPYLSRAFSRRGFGSRTAFTHCVAARRPNCRHFTNPSR